MTYHNPFCATRDNEPGPCDCLTTVSITDGVASPGNADPPTIARLRETIGQHDADQMEGGRGFPYNVTEAARAVLAEWDRGVAARNEAVEAALRDQVDFLRVPLPPQIASLLEPADRDCPWCHGSGKPCEHYPPDHLLHVHADCCK